MTRGVLLALLLALEPGADGSEVTGLSKGPGNPADIGSRCAALAGRDDRAYLDCAEQAGSAAKGGEAARPKRARPEHPGWDPGPRRRLRER